MLFVYKSIYMNTTTIMIKNSEQDFYVPSN